MEWNYLGQNWYGGIEEKIFLELCTWTLVGEFGKMVIRGVEPSGTINGMLSESLINIYGMATVMLEVSLLWMYVADNAIFLAGNLYDSYVIL